MARAELTGKIFDINNDFVSGKPKITFTVNERSELLSAYDELKTVEMLLITVQPYRRKRSLNANAYAWKLITEMSNVLRTSKEETYFNMLKRYGQSEMVSVLADVPISSFIKYSEEAGESTLNGKLFKHYRVYKGSSEFDTKEMSILIDGIVSEAEELGIQTKTPEELDRIKSLWGAE